MLSSGTSSSSRRRRTSSPSRSRARAGPSTRHCICVESWSPEHREKKSARGFWKEKPLHVRAKPLHQDDPWLGVLKNLSPPLRRIATNGVPAYGTRTRWTLALIDALTSVVAPATDAEALMLHWLHAREHASEDIEDDVRAAERQTLESPRCLQEEGRCSGPGVGRRPQAGQRLLPRAPRVTSRRTSRAAVRAPNALSSTEMPTPAFAILRRFYELVIADEHQLGGNSRSMRGRTTRPT